MIGRQSFISLSLTMLYCADGEPVCNAVASILNLESIHFRKQLRPDWVVGSIGEDSIAPYPMYRAAFNGMRYELKRLWRPCFTKLSLSTWTSQNSSSITAA
ncbi:hypothetical protein EAF04_009361 [Stromatinia cepivora]|nr:hypothetical protein EAF04_009361 [Stromatinia cepivora]